eukprot:m.45750 g.45750  ORF g.45750 m.45750 type:complete len:858 (+) comp20050_c0_seq1:187-2760(+)
MSYEYARSCDVDIPITIQIKQLVGKPKEVDVSQLLQDADTNPARLDGQDARGTLSSELYVVCQVFGNGSALALATQTSYKSFQRSIVWDEWLDLPVKYSSLPRDATIAITVYDIKSVSETKVVGGAVLKLFHEGNPLTEGTVQEGQLTLVLTEGADGAALALETMSSHPQEMGRLEELMQRKNHNELQQVAWLDSVAKRAVSKRMQNEVHKSNEMHVLVEVPYFDHRVVYCEQGADLTLASGGYIMMDPEIVYTDNLVENKHKALARSRRRGPNERDLKPNPAIRDKLSDLIRRPPTQVLTNDEKDLIWRFRFYLVKQKKALTKFLRCIDWNDPVEIKQAIEILDKWEKIDVTDALELLQKSFTHPRVRSYAVSRLDSASSEELSLYLLQLVQALKYEPLITQDGAPADFEMNMAAPNPADGDQPQTTTTMPTPVPAPAARVNPGLAPMSLAGFLIRRASEDNHLGSYFFWYILVECKDPNKVVSRMFTKVWNEFCRVLGTGTPKQQQLKQGLKRQRDFLAGLRNVSQDLSNFTGNRLKKIEKLRSIFAETPLFRSFEPLALPLDPGVIVTGIKAETAYVFKSALNPLKIDFQTSTGKDFAIIYKNGDDLRQDQLCLNIIQLIDRLLKNENLDLKLTVYGAMATSTDIGMVEFVQQSTPIAAILSKQGTIQKFLRDHNRDDDAPYQINKDVMDTYVKSCAGYCVITYILGLGDRHFDNLMLTEDGHLFHIDFGYILGRDPKPYPPPMKLTKEMIEGMGGQNGEEMKKFRSHCFNSYLIIRKHANLILNLFALMVDSSVHDIALDPDKTVMKVQDKFRLDLSDEMAVKYFEELIDESVSAMFAQFVEKLHTWAQYWRK